MFDISQEAVLQKNCVLDEDLPRQQVVLIMASEILRVDAKSIVLI